MLASSTYAGAQAGPKEQEGALLGNILGGVIVRMQDTIIDGSVRGTLERLREQLLQEV